MLDKNMNEWVSQVKQLESILTSKDHQYEQLRQQKLEVEEQMEQMLTNRSQKS